MLNIKKGFTLVELIVVISILGILATIGFISYSGYLLGVRDSNRLAQLEGLTKGLNVSLINGRLPYPENKININSGSVNPITIAYQGVVGDSVLERIGYSNKGLDPKDKTPFLYYISNNRKYFQLLSFLEDNETQVAGINKTYAATDYSTRFPAVSGFKLGILLTNNNEPLAEYLLNSGISEINIADVNNLELKSYLKTDQFVVGSGSTFVPLIDIDKVGGKYYSVVSNSFVYTPPTD